jgi:hypothetical protein
MGNGRATPRRKHTGAVAVRGADKINVGENGIVRRVGRRRRGSTAEPTKHRISLGRRDEDVWSTGNGSDDADLAFHKRDAVLSSFLCAPEGCDGAPEQDQYPGDIAHRAVSTGSASRRGSLLGRTTSPGDGASAECSADRQWLQPCHLPAPDPERLPAYFRLGTVGPVVISIAGKAARWQREL